VSAPGAYVHQGAYAYAARVQPNALYPSGRVATGQTVFTRLVHRVGTGFGYRFVSSLPHSVSGTAHLDATLQSSTGWPKQVSSSSRRFSGDRAQVAGTLDIRKLEQQVLQYSRLTGIGNDSFSVVLTPSVAVHGSVGGSPVNDTFAPTPLTFVLDGTSLRVQQ